MKGTIHQEEISMLNKHRGIQAPIYIKKKALKAVIH
jgi:hypothetical protein